MSTENKESCPQRDSAERKGYVKRAAYSTGYGRKETVQSWTFWVRYWIRTT